MSGSDQIWAEALRTLERGQPFALATVVNVRGSTPREVGAKMIVRADGQFGTIGGGCGEAEVFRKARVLLDENGDRTARLAEVDLTGDFDQREIGTCGGIMDVFVDLWSPARDLGIARKLADASSRSAPGALLTVVDSGSRAELPQGSRTFIDPRDTAARNSRPIDLPAAGFAQIVERTADAIPTLLAVDSAGGLQAIPHLAPNCGLRPFDRPAARRPTLRVMRRLGSCLAASRPRQSESLSALKSFASAAPNSATSSPSACVSATSTARSSPRCRRVSMESYWRPVSRAGWAIPSPC